MVLWGVISVGDQTDAQIFASLQLAGFVDMITYFLYVFSCRGDIAALTTGAVLNEDQVAVVQQQQ